MVTITQFTPSAYVNTLKRIDWMIAFTVSSIPTETHTQTNAVARGRCARRAISASKARSAVARSPYPIISRNSIGTLVPTAPGARIVPPTMRNACTHSNGANADSNGNRARRGATYQRAISEYATRLNVNWIPNNTIGSIIHPLLTGATEH